MERRPANPNAPAQDSDRDAYKLVKSARLRVGSKLRFPINDQSDVLLLAEGQTITPSFLQKLKQRGILEIRIHESEIPRICAGEPQGTASSTRDHRDGAVCDLKNDWTEMLDAEIRSGMVGLPPQGEAFANSVTDHGSEGYSEQLRDEIAEHRFHDVGRIQNVFESLAGGQGLDVNALSEVTDSALTDLAADSDLFACIGVNPFAEGYPARHSLHVCMLSMVIGTRLQLDRQTLKELAIGCLIHDSGMLKINQAIFRSNKTLTSVEFLEITKHPVIIFDMMKDMRSVSNRSAFIAYQMHERCNGQGYPRRLDHNRIHFLSKLAAVADAYIGLVSPRAYRPALLPYFAMEQMLKGVKAGLFDSAAVRALLDTLSLFPSGSYVEISDGRIGKVIRSNRNAYTQPIVEVRPANDMFATPEVVNLADSDLRISRPLVSLSNDG